MGSRKFNFRSGSAIRAAPNVYRQFYLLPSRRRPATPVKLKPHPSATPPRCNLPLILAGATDLPRLNDQLSAAILARLDDNKTADFGSPGQSGLTAIRLSPAIFGQIQPPQQRSGLAAPGWWYLETYASEHYFLVEADEDAAGPDGPFNNDRFRIEVELGEEPFADEDPVPPQNFKVEGELGAWFNYQRLKSADKTGTVTTEPCKVTRHCLELELNEWLAPSSANDGLLVAAPPVALTASLAPTPGSLETKVTMFRPWLPSDASLSSSSSSPQGLGSVLAAEIMQLKTDAPSPNRFVLKIMVLDEPWRYTRVRLRIERNMRDVNDDNIPDINPLFQMFGDFSGWSSHGRETVELDFRDMQARHLPAALATMMPTTTLSEFLAPASQVFKYGDLLGAALDAPFTDSTYATQWFWDKARARSKRYGVTGLIVQRRPDLHPRHAQTELTDQLENRIEDIPRLHLAPFISDSVDPAPRDFAPLLQAISKSEVPSPHHAVQVVWSNPDGGMVLSCVWPIRFRP